MKTLNKDIKVGHHIITKGAIVHPFIHNGMVFITMPSNERIRVRVTDADLSPVVLFGQEIA